MLASGRECSDGVARAWPIDCGVRVFGRQRVVPHGALEQERTPCCAEHCSNLPQCLTPACAYRLARKRAYCHSDVSGTSVCHEEGCPNDTLTARARDTVSGIAGAAQRMARDATGSAEDSATQAQASAQQSAGAAKGKAQEVGAQAQDAGSQAADAAERAKVGAKQGVDAAQEKAKEVGAQAEDAAARAQAGAKQGVDAAQEKARKAGEQVGETVQEVRA